MKKALAARVNYYREMGIYDFYRRPIEKAEEVEEVSEIAVETIPTELHEVVPENSSPMPKATRSSSQPPASALPTAPLPTIQDKPAALAAIREYIGDCTRCRLHTGRTKLVFGVGNPNADIMFVGEGPGADEDAQGEPFVGRAGQLLNNMITAMGIRREDVYIANVVKCRILGGYCRIERWTKDSVTAL